jgi:hypothetical protein
MPANQNATPWMSGLPGLRIEAWGIQYPWLDEAITFV